LTCRPTSGLPATDHVSTDFDVNSSCRFPFTAPKYTQTHTDRQRRRHVNRTMPRESLDLVCINSECKSAYHGIKSWMKYDVTVVGDSKRVAVDSELCKQCRQCHQHARNKYNTTTSSTCSSDHCPTPINIHVLT